MRIRAPEARSHARGRGGRKGLAAVPRGFFFFRAPVVSYVTFVLSLEGEIAMIFSGLVLRRVGILSMLRNSKILEFRKGFAWFIIHLM